MAKVGEQLLQPETGWKRYDDTDSNISYVGDYWTAQDRTQGMYLNTMHVSRNIGNTVTFNFTGTSLRIISDQYADRATINVYIDNQLIGNYSLNGNLRNCILLFEKLNLSKNEHSCILKNVSGGDFIFDAIDIDENGTLLPYKPITIKYLIQDKNNILYSLEDGSYTKNLIPKMTSNTTPSGIASASNVCNDSDYYQPWKAFDEDKTKHQGWITNKNVLTGWLSYKFSKREIIQKYIISTGGNPQEAPASWTFEGSNDESKWVILDTQSNIVNWSPCEEKDFYFNNNRGFLYYRINISKNNGFMYVGILQLQMYSKLITLNKLGNDLTEDLFKNKGMSDPTIIQKQEVNQKEIYGVNKGSLSSGKLFEFDLNNDMKTIQNIE